MKDKQGKSRFGFSHALNGLKSVITTELNFRIHLIASLCVIAAGIVFRLEVMQWAVVVLVIGFVLVTEVINTSIEKMMDYLKPDIHPRAKAIKDMAAGAVLISAVIAVVVGLLIFIPEILSYIQTVFVNFAAIYPRS
ncbi:diacylglycerol kinase family protein [Lentibacillus sp. CBA3610]|uniref:diacylglycerol kinase family protein n=1 Tax=Lentibacillus sp. CBA3610 TaxID=2518176 RepID=UPI0020D238B2|nr:diacylglycerol kinase family protein [Lentibacillus sp. CBA3610]